MEEPATTAELWSSILDSVSSSRSIPSKQIVLLGLRGSGKTTLTNAFLKKEPAQDDFALTYDFADVRDDADEDTLARLSVYSIPADNPTYTSLIPEFLNPKTCLPNTLVAIVLDWTRPYTFVEQLEIWLKWIETWVKGDGSREVQIAKEESRERLQSHLQHYAEPSSDPLPTSSSSLQGTLLPLGPGTFTDNFAGVPIIVVCTKSDLIDEQPAQGASGMSGMVKGKGGEWEERTDGIMQVLRTICLKYGAALFYTTQNPDILQALRQYALHLLFMPPAPSPAVASGNEPAAPIRNPFPFSQKPNVLDRDRVVIPVGWDSWGKIGVLRDGFDAKAWCEAWDTDLESDPDPDTVGAKKLYCSIVPDHGFKPHPFPAFNSPTPEQQFLAKHYDENAKKPDRDPRGAFRNPSDIINPTAGIVGPMESSSFNMPNVERALSEMETGIGGLSTGDATTRRATRAPANGARPGALNGLATSPSSNSPPPSRSQNEVLQNFFQSLLTSKSPRPGLPTSPNRGNDSVNGTSSEDTSA